MFFSFIVPTYNAAKNISICINSVLKQTFTDFEIIVLDAKSTDDTVEILRSFNDSRIKIISEKDQGIFDAMNKGIDLAKGEYLFFLGSDDVLAPGVTNAITGDVNFVEYDLIYGKVQYPSRLCGAEYNVESLTKVMLLNPFIHLFMHHQGTFIRKKLFKQFGKYELQYRIGADVHFFIKVINHRDVRKKYWDGIISLVGDKGISAETEEMRLRYEFPVLAKQHLNVDIDIKSYYRNFAKYYFDEIYQKDLIKGLNGILRLCFLQGDIFFHVMNAGYWFNKRLFKK